MSFQVHFQSLWLVDRLGLSKYLEEIRKFPMLEPARGIHAGQSVGRSMQDSGRGREARSHRICRLVARIAMGYRGYGLPIGEVISEGNVGLMQAVKRFEPDQGLSSRHICHVVDPRLHSRIYSCVRGAS